jgi:serine protease Do
VVGITNMKITLGENVGFAIPARHVKDFVRHREAFAFDKNNPNSGHFYHPAPPRPLPGAPSGLDDGSSRPGSDTPNK